MNALLAVCPIALLALLVIFLLETPGRIKKEQDVFEIPASSGDKPIAAVKQQI